ncbi:MAG: iron donor protein CyaY [Paraperlucidibaca sp.]|nr:iron donor protein CyaY [Paraperlucidibaca sp.]MBQ0722982.1 iron donor protein CyaY [Paraperlucidibaca sp.]MBQ0842442.1 iron donor protein CyaY [Paraperlucidibaca sp.]
MNESEFNALAEATLLSIEQQVEDADTELDFEMSSGILTLTAENGSKIIINRQVATLEIWVAARSGGFHLGRQDNVWFCQSTGETLQELLTRVVVEQGGEKISFT